MVFSRGGKKVKSADLFFILAHIFEIGKSHAELRAPRSKIREG